MKGKIVIAGLVILLGGNVAMADLTWGYAGDLTGVRIPNSHLGGGPGLECQAGWHVQMYHDVFGDSQLDSIDYFSLAGVPGGIGVVDDLLLSITSSLSEGSKTGIAFGESISTATWSPLFSEDVYTVVFSGTSIGSAEGGLVLDPVPRTLPASDPGDYVIRAIPEPSTIGLMGVAGLGMFLARRKSPHTRHLHTAK